MANLPKLTQRLPMLGAKTEAIITLANSIELSIKDFVASVLNHLTKDELKSFLETIQASTTKIRSLSTDIVSSGVVGLFIKFPKLPLELRLKIWKFSLRQSSPVVKFFAKLSSSGANSEHNFGVRQAPDILFQVCRESRQVATERYSLQISTSKSALANTRIDPRKEIFCFAPKKAKSHGPDYRDLFVLKSRPIWSYDVLRLKRIAITHQAPTVANFRDLLRKFTLVEEIIGVVDLFDSGDTGEKELVACPPNGFSQYVKTNFEDCWRLYGVNLRQSKKPVVKVMKIVRKEGRKLKRKRPTLVLGSN
jgi:hypothetical protein